MNCEKCGRELREDSVFCDYCGHKISNNHSEQSTSKLNTNILILGILLSVFFTLLISGIAKSFGVPLFFGGLFLPLFWYRLKKK